MLKKLKGLVVEEKGQALTEYGLIIALVAIAIAGTLTIFKGDLEKVFTKIAESFPK